MTKTIQSRSIASLHKPKKDLIIIKRIENKENNLRLLSSITRIFVISIVCILLTAIAISIFTIHTMKTTNQKLADTIGVEKIDNDIEKVVNGNIVKFIIRMTVITVAILLASVVSFGLGYKYKYLSRKVKGR
jgi:quinol-cytochrome oxidoreductase complex cytochrome b subunit